MFYRAWVVPENATPEQRLEIELKNRQEAFETRQFYIINFAKNMAEITKKEEEEKENAKFINRIKRFFKQFV